MNDRTPWGWLHQKMMRERPVSSAVMFRVLLGTWTLGYFLPRLPYLEELYCRPVLRQMWDIGRTLAPDPPALWLVRAVCFTLVMALVLFIFGVAPRLVHVIVILPALTYMTAIDQVMPRAYGILSYSQWLLMFVMPYDALKDDDGRIRTAPAVAWWPAMVQYLSVYYFTVPAKLVNGNGWENGRAIYYAFRVPRYGDHWMTHYFPPSRAVATFIGWVTMCAEITLPTLLVIQRTRWVGIAGVFVMHFIMWISLRVSLLFHSLMMLQALLWLDDKWWQRLFDAIPDRVWRHLGGRPLPAVGFEHHSLLHGAPGAALLPASDDGAVIEGDDEGRIVKREINPGTQPFLEHPVFNNWEVVAEGWYYALPSRALKRGRAQSLTICGHRVVLFRGDDDKVRALDAFCPHMGTDLGIGKVQGDTIRCFFHHWRFDETGACVEVPCGDKAPAGARLHAWDCCERYGFIWVFPAERASGPLVSFPELGDAEVVAAPGKPFERGCHHHVNMINGLDAQHLSTVHQIRIDGHVTDDEDQSGTEVTYLFEGEVPSETLKERLSRWLLGPRYAYGMRYGHASVGALTLVKDIRLFGTGPKLPELFTLFAYRTKSPGVSEVQPIFLAQKRPGLFGALWSRALILAARVAYRVLRDEDGAIYENIRFNPRNLTPTDQPVARYIAFVNRLKPSAWSARPAEDNGEERATRLRVVDGARPTA